MKIYKIASEAIKEYIENHPKDDEQIEDLIKTAWKEVESMGFDFLPGENFFTNKNISKKYGLKLASFIGYLVDADESFDHKDGDPWFSLTIEEVEKSTGYKNWKQENLLKQLEELGIIERKLIGLPAKRYFKLNYDKINELASLTEEPKKEWNYGKYLFTWE